jgi:hypothetical protein
MRVTRPLQFTDANASNDPHISACDDAYAILFILHIASMPITRSLGEMNLESSSKEHASHTPHMLRTCYRGWALNGSCRDTCKRLTGRMPHQHD